MDVPSRDRLAEHWPDIADDLAQVIPDGCVAIRVEDEWIQQKYAAGNRLRTVDLARPIDGPELEALADATRARARKSGWRQIHREEAERQDVFRRTIRHLVKMVPQFLRVWPGRVEYADTTCETLRVDLEAGWSRARMAPELEGRMIYELVRHRWGLQEPERSNRSETVYDLRDPTDKLLLREAMELPLRSDMRALVERHGLEPVDLAGGDRSRWIKRERYTKGELTTAVSIGAETATIAVELDRSARLR